MLIGIGILIGAIIYWLGNLKSLREDTSYVGGEVIPDEHRVTGVDFYNTIKDFKPFGVTYQRAERKLFDIYDWGRNIALFFTGGLRKAHTGILSFYLCWILIGLIVLFLVLIIK